MKSAYSILFFILSLTPLGAQPNGFYENFSNWETIEEFEKELEVYKIKFKNEYYPIAIQAGASMDGVPYFRALFTRIPRKEFNYKIIYGASEIEFTEKNSTLTKMGFQLIYHQSAHMTESISHQAVWTKTGANQSR